ncbi:hypothetical protein ACTFIZ_005433 [Dictyostelium cf. discoideum]
MNKILLIVIVLASICGTFALSSSSSSSSLPLSEYRLYSVQTKYSNQKELLVIDPFNYKVLFNYTINNLQYSIVQILSLDTTTGELLLLCSEASFQILVSVTAGSPKYTQLGEVQITNKFNYDLLSYIWIPDQKTAAIPAEIEVNGIYSNYIMATEFGNQKVELYNLTHLEFAPLLIQGYDYINNIYYIAFMNQNASFHLLSFDYTNPAETAKYYYDISNIAMVNMVFTDPSGNVYFLNQQYKNSSEPTGYYDICRVTLSDQPSCGPSLYTIYLGNEFDYDYIPHIQSQDSSTILFIVNQAPGVTGFTKNILLSYVQLNGHSVTVTNVTIPNDNQSSEMFAAKFYAF